MTWEWNGSSNSALLWRLGSQHKALLLELSSLNRCTNNKSPRVGGQCHRSQGTNWQINSSQCRLSEPFVQCRRVSPLVDRAGLVCCTLFIYGLSSIYTLQLAAKFGFQPWTSKPDNFGPPTLEKVQLSTLPAVLRMNSNFWYFRECRNFILFFPSILTPSNEKTQNYKVVDLIEVYNLHIKFIFIRHRIEGFSIFWNLSLITR